MIGTHRMTRIGYIAARLTVAAPFFVEVYPFGFTSWRRAGP